MQFDMFNILLNPELDVQYYEGVSSVTLKQWHTWRKPRGAKMVYILTVGGAGGGASSNNTIATSSGAGGGGSGGQTSIFIPAIFLPEILYIQPGIGGLGATTVAAAGGTGVVTYVCIEPDTTLNAAFTFILANGGTGGAKGTETNGGAGGAGGGVAAIASMPLAGRGFYSLLVGQGGTAGGTDTAVGVTLTAPITGLMVTGGAGGGGCQGTGTGLAGGIIQLTTAPLGNELIMNSIAGGVAGSGSTPAGNGIDGFVSSFRMMNFGGTGGGGATSTAGGLAGRGGNGAPGCGGGGAGGNGSGNPTVQFGGNGGHGFVYIISYF